MFEATGFSYDGISSDDMGVAVVNPGTGLFKENFLAPRKIVEKSVAGRNTNYFVRVEESPLSFPLTIYIEDWERRNNLRAIARWLDQEEYKPFWFSTTPDRVMFCLVEGSPQLIHNGIKDGYITLNIRCNSPFMYSQEIKYKRTISNYYDDWINNSGDKPIAPYLKIKKIGNGNITIKTTQENREINNFTITDLLDGELIEIDCAEENIKTNYEKNERYLFDNTNKDWVTFVLGNPYDQESSTHIEFIGNFELEMTYRMIYRAE